VTPNLAVIEILAPNWRMPRLWLPLFLLWIPVILLSPLILLVFLAAGVAFRINPWRAIAVFWNLLCALPGTDVRVVSDGTRIVVKIL
jgi:hypothetical protein